jgi:AcrR family transcriptional regulator
MTNIERTATREPLDAERIVGEAIALADDQGVAGLTMRRLADRLGYKVMSLYNHVPNKDDLLARMVDAVAAEIAPATDCESPLDGVRSIAISTHDALVRHPWAAELWQRYLPGQAQTSRMEDLLRLLNTSGLSPELAHDGFHAVTNHVLGYTLQQLGMTLSADDPTANADVYLATLDTERHPHMMAHVQQHLDGDTASSFGLVLDLILEGLVRRNRGLG